MGLFSSISHSISNLINPVVHSLTGATVNAATNAAAPVQTEAPETTALRNKLNASLKDIPGYLQEEKSNLKSSAEQNLSKGLQSTRRNYNQRGLLYSGLRQGAEEKVRGGVASQYQGSLADAEKEYKNLEDKRKQAIASLGLASQEKALTTAQDAFDLSMKNAVARRQAFQQFGSGLGTLAGYAASLPGSKPQTQSPPLGLIQNQDTSNYFNSPYDYSPNYKSYLGDQ